MDISVIINLHREGILAQATFKSVLVAVRCANDKNLSVETLFILDKADRETSDLVDHFINSNNFNAQKHSVNFGDLGLSRNYGISKSSGDYIALIDADDLWGYDWLWKAYDSDVNYRGKAVWHPEVNFIFEDDYHIYFHTDMDDPNFDLDYLRISNYWTALSFAKKSTYLSIPYNANEITSGFGYEDWNWHCETIFSGYKHKVVPGSCHFIRKKGSNSLLSTTKTRNCIMTPSKLFQ